MNKEEAGLLGASLMTIAIFMYGIKHKMGWKYWLFTLLILPTSGAAIGVALGKAEPLKKVELEKES